MRDAHQRPPFERPLGAAVGADGSTTFRVWAPAADGITLRVGDREHELADEGFGVRAATVEARAGEDYCFVVDGRELPDPCTRHQPHGLRGRSRVVDPAALQWTDGGWDGVALEDLVVYELHVGTFTAAGTFEAAIEDLPRLAALGVNAIELMPVAEFPGTRGWGYDGVYLAAAHHAYGGPEGLAALVDAAHSHGIAVILDVVFNHVGASGEQALRAFGPYFTDRYSTFWGEALNYDDEWSDPVREWVLQTVDWWVRDLHLDGLRLDAIHSIFDSSPEHLVAAVARRAHAANWRALVIAESGLNDPRVVRDPEQGGWGCDAAWADDVHHAIRTLVTDEREGYYEEFGRVEHLAHALRDPHIHDGCWSSFRKRRFGAPAGGEPPERFVAFSQNHDQVGNRAFGDRMPAEARPLAAFCTLLSPYVPMLFMGEEYGEEAPFQFFTDHIDEEIAIATREGRRREFAAFAQFAGEEIPDPQDPATFERSKLTRKEDPALSRLYAELLHMRRELPRAHPEHVEFDDDARWLRARCGPMTLAMSFARGEQVLALERCELVLATHDGVVVQDDGVRLPPLSGALLRAPQAVGASRP